MPAQAYELRSGGSLNSPGHDPRGGGDRYSPIPLYQPGSVSIGS